MSLFVVNSHVVSKVSVFSKTFSTLLAGVRLKLSGVISNVPVKGSFLNVTSSTICWQVKGFFPV